MKISVPVAALLALILSAEFLPAADNSLKILAARQELEEFIRRTNTRIRDLEEAQVEQQRYISRLEAEIRKLRGELAQPGNDNRLSILETNQKELTDLIRQIDKNRVADNKATQEEFKRLATLIGRSSSTPATRTPAEPVIPRGADLFKYKIQKGDYLVTIVSKLKKQGVNVTMEEIQKANPQVVWTKLQIGQEIIIPVSKD